MRPLLDANILLDCLILEKSGLPRAGKAASERVLELCDQRIHTGLIAWHTLPILAYYYSRQHSPAETGAMLDDLAGLSHRSRCGTHRRCRLARHGSRRL